MPEVALQLVPTVNADWTPTLNQSAIASCQAIRFRDKLPQKLGGWTKFFQSSVSGIPRDLHPWEDLNNAKHLAIGTTTALNVITDDVLTTITPQKFASDFAPNFSTTSTNTTVIIVDPNINNVTVYDSIFLNTPISVGGIILQGAYPIDSIGGATQYDITSANPATATVSNGGAVPEFVTSAGSAIVAVNFNDHGLAVNGTFTFPIATTNDGVTILGTYSILTVPSANQFTIAASTSAIAGATFSMNGGNAEIIYYIALGPPAAGVGFGVGAFGAGGFGSGVVPSAQTGTPITTTNWSLDNWGKLLLATPKNGGLYQWSPDGGFSNAQLVPTAPIFNGGMFIAMPEQIAVMWASTPQDSTQQDNLTVRWSDVLDFTNFTPTASNFAGEHRISTGSKIVGGLQAPQQALIWTDLSVWSMQFLGLPDVFGFNEVSTGCGLTGQHAACVMRGVVYWMSSGNFFQMIGSSIAEIPCTVWDVIFQDLDTDNQDKCIAAPNSAFDEVTFYYPSLSGGTGEIDSYVKYNTEMQSWDYGKLQRTAWTDQSILGEPIGTTAAGVIYQHETSNDADGQALLSSFTTGWFVITEGQNIAFVDWLWPDMKWGLYGQSQGASVQVTIDATSYPNGSVTTYGPFTMNATKAYINLRLRGRMIRLTFSSSDVGSFWRMGLPRYRVAPDGRR